jgi:hypothetical protein
MQPEQYLPHVVKVTDTPGLLALEDKAAALDLSQRLVAEWLAERLAPAGKHYLWPALWHRLSHRPEVSPHLRCELLFELRNRQYALSLLDVMPQDFEPIPSVGSRSELIRVRQLMESATPVGEWSGRP